MTQRAWTEGPWGYAGREHTERWDGHPEIEAAGETVCYIEPWGDANWENVDADGRLIALAPEMAEAILAAVDTFAEVNGVVIGDDAATELDALAQRLREIDQGDATDA